MLYMMGYVIMARVSIGSTAEVTSRIISAFISAQEKVAMSAVHPFSGLSLGNEGRMFALPVNRRRFNEYKH